jgi:hypothetical protein
MARLVLTRSTGPERLLVAEAVKAFGLPELMYGLAVPWVALAASNYHSCQDQNGKRMKSGEYTISATMFSSNS